MSTQIATRQGNSSNSAAAIMFDLNLMDAVDRVANIMSSGRNTVPKHLVGSHSDCFAVTLQSMQWGMNPFAVAQKTHLVNGTLGYEAQLVAAVINSSGLVKDRFNFEWFGAWEKIIGRFKEVESKTKKDDNGYAKKYIVPAWKMEDEQGLGVTVWATIKDEAEPRKLTLFMTQARTRNSTLWTEDPKQQLAYLAQKRWARLHAPDVILGVYTPDELDTPPPAEKFMGDADLAGDEGKGKPAYPEESFAANYQKYEAAAKKGNEKARPKLIKEGLLSKYTLTPEQIRRIDLLDNLFPVPMPNASEAAPPAAAPVAPAPDPQAPQFTRAEIEKRMRAASSFDELNEAANLSGCLTSEADNEYIDQLYEELSGKLSDNT